MRSAIVCLLALATLAGGCDRTLPGKGQGGADATPTASAAPVAVGTIDHGHAGEAAPDFAFQDAGGSGVTLARFRGAPVLVNIWATWCAPCIAEMPALDALAARAPGGLQVVTISQDLNGADAVLPFYKAKGIKALKPWLDPDLHFSTAMAANLPVSILYGSNGREVWRVAGPMDWGSAAVAKQLAEAK